VEGAAESLDAVEVVIDGVGCSNETIERHVLLVLQQLGQPPGIDAGNDNANEMEEGKIAGKAGGRHVAGREGRGEAGDQTAEEGNIRLQPVGGSRERGELFRRLHTRVVAMLDGIVVAPGGAAAAGKGGVGWSFRHRYMSKVECQWRLEHFQVGTRAREDGRQVGFQPDGRAPGESTERIFVLPIILYIGLTQNKN
jgi:hypothetical protein